MKIRKKKANTAKKSLFTRSVSNRASQSAPSENKSKPRNISEAKAALVSMLAAQCIYWNERKHSIYFEFNPEAWRYFDAMSYAAFSAETDLNAIPITTEIKVEDFYFNVLEITRNANWGKDENYSGDIQEMALNAIKDIIIQNVPKAVVEKYQQNSTGRGSISVFLSYSSKDIIIVEKFVSYLRRKGLPIWYDKHEICIGDEIHSKISEGINRAQYFCIFLSKHSVGSKWVQDELRQAIERVHLFEAKVFPIMLEECVIPGYLRGINYGDLRNRQDEDSIKVIVEQVVTSIDKYLNPISPPA